MSDVKKLFIEEDPSSLSSNKLGSFIATDKLSRGDHFHSLAKLQHQSLADSPAYQKSMYIASLLSEFFPKPILISFVSFIHSSFKDQPSTTGKRIPCYKFHFESDRCALLLAFMTLVLQKQDKTIEHVTLNKINSLTAYSLSFTDINKWKKKIKKTHPKLYTFYKKNHFGPNGKAFISCYLDCYTDFDTTQVTPDQHILLRARALELAKIYVSSPQFKKTKSFQSICQAIIALAYTDVTGKQGIPFNLPKKICRYISARRSFVKKVFIYT